MIKLLEITIAWITELIKRRKLFKELKQISLKVAKKYGIKDRKDIKEIREVARKSHALIKAKNKYSDKTLMTLTKEEAYCYVIREILK